MYRKIYYLFPVVLIAVILGGVLLSSTPVHADTPPPDIPCRGCHGDNQRQLTLPSGELLPLLVPLDELDASAHSSVSTTPVSCTGCHSERGAYRYPHRENPAQTHDEFTLSVEASCKECHYPHQPFHAEIADKPEAPTCTDCHGVHDIAPVEQIQDSMPDRCVACHTDQAPAWASDLLSPRPGLGVGQEGYAGSARCLGCHDGIYTTWKDTLHARMIQDARSDAGVIVGNFNISDPDLTFTAEDVDYTIGSRWKQRYIQQDEEGNFRILPAQWNVATGEWVAYHAEDWQERDWRQTCGSCHVTGLNTKTWTFTEFGIGCEGCHGPGEKHAADPERVHMFAESDDQVCGSCHSRGESPDGLSFPATYRPGDNLADHFSFTTDESALWPDGSAKKHHQQYMDWQLGSDMSLSEETSCTTCHSVHDSGAEQSQLKKPVGELCVECHSEKKALYKHTPYHEQAREEKEFTCVDCHMPTMATSAVPFDIHNHSFKQPDPQATVEYGGVDIMPNACNLCHTGRDEGPEWAAQTIAYVKKVSPKRASLGPGPTPTPPPPPTPLPSVGQPAEPVSVQTWGWVRTTAFAVMILGLAAILFLVFRSLRSRRSANG